jgi:hypothetical protein
MSFANGNKKQAEEYWKKLLAGSKMSRFIEHTHPSFRNVLYGAVNCLIKTPASSHKSVTVATILKAAWALVLADLSGDADVAFGATTWGRNVKRSTQSG